MYESHDSEERERPVCRCKGCLNKIKKSEEEMAHSMKSMDYEVVNKALTNIHGNKIDIDAKLSQ